MLSFFRVPKNLGEGSASFAALAVSGRGPTFVSFLLFSFFVKCASMPAACWPRCLLACWPRCLPPVGLDACCLLASMLACLLASMPAACWPRCLLACWPRCLPPVGLDACRLLASMPAACWPRCLLACWPRCLVLILCQGFPPENTLSRMSELNFSIDLQKSGSSKSSFRSRYICIAMWIPYNSSEGFV